MPGATLIVTNGGQFYFGPNNTSWNIIGLNSSNNALVVSGGRATLNGGNQQIYIGYTAGWSNSLTIDGQGVTDGATATNISTFNLGFSAANHGNYVMVTNGGRLGVGPLYVGYTGVSASNRVTVIGSADGSATSTVYSTGVFTMGGLRSQFIVDGLGSFGSAAYMNMAAGNHTYIGGISNVFIVTNKGYVFHTSASTYNDVGAGGSDGRLEIVDGGVMIVTNAAMDGSFRFGVSSGNARNTMIVRGAGSYFSAAGILNNAGDIGIGWGAGSISNGLIVDNGGVISNSYLYIGGTRFGGPVASSNNYLRIASGGKVYNAYNNGGIGVGYPTMIGESGPLNTALVTDADSLWDLGTNTLALYGMSNGLTVANSGTMTNLMIVYVGYGRYAYNQVSVTNGGRMFFFTNPILNTMTLGMTAGTGSGSNNTVLIRDAGSVVNLRGGSVNIGWPGVGSTNASTGNVIQVFSSGLLTNIGTLWVGNTNSTLNTLLIDSNGVVDAVGNLVVWPSNMVTLNWGMLGVSNVTMSNGQVFLVGDGVNSATLKALGGTVNVTNGLLVMSNAWVKGYGTINAGAGVVIITNTGAFSPGINGCGSMTIAGSNLTWYDSGIYDCEITNFNSSAGVGWDIVNINAPLSLVPIFERCVIKLDTMGQPAAGFRPNVNYLVPIMTVKNPGDFVVGSIALDTNAFLNALDGAWSVTNIGTNVYLNYQANSPSNVVAEWDGSSNGNWSAGMNWKDRQAPSTLVPTTKAVFGAAGNTYYSATNDLGTFWLNSLVLTNQGTAVPLITGNGLEFRSAGAAIEEGGNGSILISNAVNLTTNLILTGSGTGVVTLAGNITGAGMLTKQGASTFALKGSNNFSGQVTVSNGTLRLENTNALGANSVVVNNGTLMSGTNLPVFTFGNGPARTALITGNNSIWTNGTTSTNLTLGSNAVVTVQSSGRLAVGSLVVANAGTVPHGLIVTNGGQVFSANHSVVGNLASNNAVLVTGSGSVWNGGGSNILVGSGSASSSNNALRVDNNGQVTNAVIIVGNSANQNSLIITNNGKVAVSGDAFVGINGSSNAALVVGGNGVVSLWDMNNFGLTVASSSSSNMVVVDGKGVEGSAVITNINVLNIGNPLTAGNYNSLVVTNKGQVILSGVLRVGYESMRNCSLTIVEGGQVIKTDNADAFVGYQANGTVWGNRMIVSGVGSLYNGGGGTLGIGRPLNGAGQTTNSELWVSNGGVVTNAQIREAYSWGSISLALAPRACQIVVTNGGRIYNMGSAFYLGGCLASFNTAIVSSVNSLWDNGGQGIELSSQWGGVGSYTQSNNVMVVDGALVTNVTYVKLASTSGGYKSGDNNSLMITNGGRIYSSGNVQIADVPATNTANNAVTIIGTGSLWDLAGGNLTLGAAYTNPALTMWANSNSVTLDQNASLDNIGVLNVATNNTLYFNYGTLGLASGVISNGSLFVAGNGVNPSMLKILGGTCKFQAGLLITSNTTLKGNGAISGLETGVIITNGATLMPGLTGAGALTIGSNLAWHGGSTYRCAITNMNLGAGLGWSLVTVSTQLMLVSGGNNFVIQMDSLGAPVANFDPNANYQIKIMSFGSQTGYDPAQFMIDTNAFLCGSSTAWTLTNVLNNLYLVYRGAPAPAAATLTWQVPNTGNWSEGTNWVGGTPPSAGGDLTHVVSFGDNGTPYTSTNDLAGGFQMNQWQFTSASAATNIIKGSGMLVLTNNGLVTPRLDYLDGANGGFIISNAVTLATDTTLGGDAFGGTVLLNGAVTNLGTLTKNGQWTLALASANNSFNGPVVVDNPGGIMRLDDVAALNGLGDVTVSNGMLAVNQGANSYYFANNKNNRRGVVTGSGTVWTNLSSGTFNYQSGYSRGSSNVTFTVDGARQYWAVRFHAFDLGSRFGTAVVTNGGQLIVANYGAWMANSSTNCTVVITGTNSVLSCSGLGLTVADGAAAIGNVLRIDNGALATNINALIVASSGCHSNSLIVTNGGKMYSGNPTMASGAATYNTVLISGSNSLWYTAGNAAYIAGGTSYSNTFIIDNGGVATNVRLSVGVSCNANSLIVTNGGKLFGNASYDQYVGNGPLASSNAALVTDQGSMWNGAGTRILISTTATSSWNRLTIANKGMVTNVSTLVLADGAGSSNNSVVVDGGKLYATALAFNNSLVNSMQMDGAAEVVLGGMAMTNANHRFNFNGGTLSIKSALVSNGLEQVVGDGAQTATLNIQTGGTNVFMNGLIITNNATLAGSGLIRGATTMVYGTVSPGTIQTVGALTNAGDVVLMPGSTSLMGINANTMPGTGWDYVAVSNGTLSLGGTLKPVLSGSFAPLSGSSFVIMTNLTGTRSGFFNNALATGSRVFVYSNDLNRVVGTIQVTFGAASVVLEDYKAGAPNRGAVLMVF